MASVTLDVVFGEDGVEGDTIEDAIAGLTKDLFLGAEIIHVHGPGGGWPVIEFNGSTEGILGLLYRYHGSDMTELISYLNSEWHS